MATCILVIRTAEGAGQNHDRIGLIVEQVLGSESVNFDEDNAATTSPSTRVSFLGPVAMTRHATVQLTIPSRLPTGRT